MAGNMAAITIIIILIGGKVKVKDGLEFSKRNIRVWKYKLPFNCVYVYVTNVYGQNIRVWKYKLPFNCVYVYVTNVYGQNYITFNL